MTTAKHVDKIKPFITQQLEAAIKGGSGALTDLTAMLALAKKSDDKALIEAIEGRISGDASKVKEQFALAVIAVSNELGLPLQLKGEAGEKSSRVKRGGKRVASFDPKMIKDGILADLKGKADGLASGDLYPLAQSRGYNFDQNPAFGLVLKGLVESKLIRKAGEGRATRYYAI